jgi:hypothetical protein
MNKKGMDRIYICIKFVLEVKRKVKKKVFFFVVEFEEFF